MKHTRLEEWESKLKMIFDWIDDYLEEKYGHKYPLHPARASRGTTSSKEHDGLFNVGAIFSAGFGSEYGRGYVIEVRIVTLSRVPFVNNRKADPSVFGMLPVLWKNSIRN